MPQKTTLDVLAVVADSTRTGAPRQLSLYIPSLPKSITLHVACPAGWLADFLQDKGVVVHILPSSRKEGSRALKALVQKLSPKLIHAHGVRAGYWCILLPEKQIPLVYTEHLWTMDFHLESKFREYAQKKLLRLITLRSSTVVAVSEAVKEYLRNTISTDEKKLSVVYGAIEQSLGARHEPTIFTVGTLGTLEKTKGIDLLIRGYAAAELPEQSRLVIGGCGPELASLHKLAAQLDVADKVIFEGGITDSTAFYQQLSVYVQASRSESFGMAPLEAALLGVPVIVSDAGALPEVFPSDSAWSVLRQDSASIATALTKLAAEPDLRKALSQRGKLCAQNFTPEKTAESYSKLYNQYL